MAREASIGTAETKPGARQGVDPDAPPAAAECAPRVTPAKTVMVGYEQPSVED